MLLKFYLQQGLLKRLSQQPAHVCGWMAEMIVVVFYDPICCSMSCTTCFILFDNHVFRLLLLRTAVGNYPTYCLLRPYCGFKILMFISFHVFISRAATEEQEF